MANEEENKESAEATPESATKTEAPAAEAKAEEAPAAEAKADAAPAEAAPKADAPKADAPKADAPKADAGGRGGRGGDRGGRGGGRGGDRGGRGGRRGDRESTDGLYEKVIKINRTAKVVKGGRRFSFSVLGVVGDQKGRVGFGLGKANGVPDAIKKSFEKARQNLVEVPLQRGRTIPYEVIAKFSGVKLIMRPATPGTGIIAGGACRAVMEALGVQDILTKRIGSSNPGNVLRATFECFSKLRSPHQVAKLRGISMHQLFQGHDAPEAPAAETGGEA